MALAMELLLQVLRANKSKGLSESIFTFVIEISKNSCPVSKNGSAFVDRRIVEYEK